MTDTLRAKLDYAAVISVCSLAMCTNFGTALVSITKLFVLLVFLCHLYFYGWRHFSESLSIAPKTKWLILAAVCWMSVSALWSIATTPQLLKALYGHARWLWFFPFIYLTYKAQTRGKVVRWLMYGQLIIVSLSLLLALGVPIPFTKHNLGDEFGVVFTYHLEQPVLSTVLLALLWSQRQEWIDRLTKPLFYSACALIVVDVLFIVRGRTGYLMMLILLAIHARRALPSRMQVLGFLAPILIALAAYSAVPSFHAKVSEVLDQVTHFDQQNFNTSPGLRLDMWQRALMGIEDRPLLGHGVGSFPKVYKMEGGWSQEEWTNPHNQYLLWWNDAGIIGLLLYLGILVAARYEARQTPQSSLAGLDDVLVIALVMGLMNCPFYGVGTGEFFMLLVICMGFQTQDVAPLKRVVK